MRQPLVAGNWKMNGTAESIKSLVDGIKSGMVDVPSAAVAVCPPFVYISLVSRMLSGTGVAVGAQNVSEKSPGAYTGEIATAMLLDVGCKYAIVGHSERRSIYGENDAVVAAKYVAAVKAGLTPILCVGESLDERQSGSTETVVGRQLDAVVEAAGIAAIGQGVVAYEPVWAIGTGMTATPEQAQAVHAFIRQRLARHDAGVANRVQILYGGSVKPDNAQELFGMPDIDGGLIGGASLDAAGFLAICKAAG